MSLRQRVEQKWMDGGPAQGVGERVLRAGLRAASAAYWIGANARRVAFDAGIVSSRKAGCPVISIGNLTVGGTGKTPVVVETARILAESGLHPAIVSRGYRRADPDEIVVVSKGGKILAALDEAGDEPLMMARHFLSREGKGALDVAVVVGANRYEAAQRAIQECGADAVILDDGFQHRALARDCDIVLWDALRPVELLAMFPRGPMREGLAALRRAHALIFTRCNLGHSTRKILSRINRAAPHLVIFHAGLEAESLLPLEGTEILNPAELRGRRIGAFCGLGNPDSFWKLLEQCGATLAARRVFPDHHKPSAAQLDAWCAEAKNAGAEWVLLTEKDRENLPAGWRSPLPAYVLRAAVRFGEDAERFREFILRHGLGR